MDNEKNSMNKEGKDTAVRPGGDVESIIQQLMGIDSALIKS